MSTYAPLILGTPVVWTSSGGDKVLTCTSLTTGSAQQGAKSATLVDGTKGLPAFLQPEVKTTNLGAAPTDGLTIDLYLAFSSSATAATDNPGGVTGSDAAYTYTTAGVSQLVYAGSLVLSNSIGTGLQLAKLRLVAPLDAYVTPVLVNNSGQTLSATGTDTVVTLTPLYAQSS